MCNILFSKFIKRIIWIQLIMVNQRNSGQLHSLQCFMKFPSVSPSIYLHLIIMMIESRRNGKNWRRNNMWLVCSFNPSCLGFNTFLMFSVVTSSTSSQSFLPSPWRGPWPLSWNESSTSTKCEIVQMNVLKSLDKKIGKGKQRSTHQVSTINSLATIYESDLVLEKRKRI